MDWPRLHSIFRNTSLESSLPDKVREQTPLKVYFTFTKTIGQSLFNYCKFLKTLRIDIVKDILETDCACSSSPFLSGPCGHVVSGDLNVISKSEIRDLMKMGAEYKEPVTQPWSCNRSSIVDSVSNFVTKCAPSLSYL